MIVAFPRTVNGPAKTTLPAAGAVIGNPVPPPKSKPVCHQFILRFVPWPRYTRRLPNREVKYVDAAYAIAGEMKSPSQYFVGVEGRVISTSCLSSGTVTAGSISDGSTLRSGSSG